MGYGSMARKYGEYAAYYPHYDSFGSPNSPSPGSTGVGGSSSGSNSTHHLSQSPEVGAWPSHELSHVQHSMSNYYPHHPAFLPTHHGPTARDFREAAAAQVSLITELSWSVIEEALLYNEREMETMYICHYIWQTGAFMSHRQIWLLLYVCGLLHIISGPILELPLEQLLYQQYHAPLDHPVLIGLIKFLISRDCLMMEVSL